MKSFFPMIFPPTILILSLSVPKKWKEIARKMVVPKFWCPPAPSLYAYDSNDTWTAMIHGSTISPSCSLFSVIGDQPYFLFS
jgi:hypothetical protein